MLRPSRLSLLLSFLICGAAFWLMRQGAVVAPESFQKGGIFIQHVNVFDPASPGLQLDRQVLIVDGLIKRTEASADETPKLPANTMLIDGKNKTLLPGLIDIAAFVSLDGALPEDRRAVDYEGVLRIQLQAGVTTLVDLNASRAQMRDAGVASEPLRYPRLRHGAGILTSPGGWRPGTPGDGASPVFEISNIEDLEAAFKSNREDGCSLIIASIEHSGRDDAAFSPDLMVRLSQLCEAANLPLLIHVERLSKIPAALLASPQILIGSWATEKISPELVQKLSGAHVAYAPALQSLMGFQPPHEITAGLKAMSEPGWLSPTVIDSLGNTKALIKYAKRFTLIHASPQIAAENTALLLNAGVQLVLGTFSGMPGLPHGVALRAELGRLVDSGLSPSQALRATTINAAQAMRLPALGRVAPGFSADLLLVEGDPTKDLEALRHIAAVIRGGKYWSARELAKP